jgi:dTDP-4-dehydrorhamnose reductase
MSAKILVFGGTGLLGNALVTYLSEAGSEVTATYRIRSAVFFQKALPFDVLSDSLDALAPEYDYVLNAIGVIKPFMAADPPGAIRVNSLWPWQLMEWCARYGMKLIHISTDCVYSGKKGKYVESDPHDALDAYGKSKSLGECAEKAMILRTSIIGEEVHKHVSLLAWAQNKRGQTVDGYVTHLWNGITAKRYAAICERIMCDNLFSFGLFHIFAKDDVSKYTLLRYFNERFDLKLNILEKHPEPVNRTLRTEKSLCSKLNIPTIEQMLNEM